MMFKKVAIIGVGLIGGSIGRALKKKGLAGEIVGVCRHETSLRIAKSKRAIDQGTLNVREAVSNADLVILAVPVLDVIRIGKEIAPFLKQGALVTDAGSTKQMIVEELERALPRGVNFIGAHPLAGSEKRGAQQANAELFKNALCLLTKTKKTNPAALKKTALLWRKLGCRIKILSPQAHDKIVAMISHLPHLAAGQLVKTAKVDLGYAARGFLDSTRIASSDDEIWTDIFISNKVNINQSLNTYINNLKAISRLIRKANRTALRAECKKIKEWRDGLSR